MNKGLEILHSLSKVDENNYTCLVFSPHPDDSSFIGSTILQLLRLNVRVIICLITAGEEGFSNIKTKNQSRLDEFYDEAKTLGIKENDIFILPQIIPDDLMPENRNLTIAGMLDGNVQATKYLCDSITWIIRKVRPGVVLIPSINENHNDHKNLNLAVSQSYLRRDRNSRQDILGSPHPYYNIVEFETVSLSLGHNGLFYVLCNDESWEIREKAIRCHKSQVIRDPEAYIFRRLLNSLIRGGEANSYTFREGLQEKLDNGLMKKYNEKEILNNMILFQEFVKFTLDYSIANYPKAEAFRLI